MKHKLNIILLSLTAAGLTGTAYGLCYLEQIVCCAISGDSLGNYASVVVDNGFGGTTAVSGSLTLYADASAYRVDTYSVSKGGYGETSFTSYCDSIGNVQNELYGNGSQGYGYWNCHYYNSNNGATGTCHSSDPSGLNTGSSWVNYSVTSHNRNATTCN